MQACEEYNDIFPKKKHIQKENMGPSSTIRENKSLQSGPLGFIEQLSNVLPLQWHFPGRATMK